MQYYKVEPGGKIVPCSIAKSADWFSDAANVPFLEGGRHVAWTALTDNPEDFVSTVFLGVDHNFSGSGAPILFETMIHTRLHGWGDQWRYRTHEEALLGHANAVAEAKKLVAAESKS